MLALPLFVLLGATTNPPRLVDILSAELDRNMKILKEKGDPPPYFGAYEVIEEQAESLSASGGAVVNRSSNNSRTLDVTVRVGTMQFDNFHRNPRDPAYFTAGIPVSVDNNPDAIKRYLWEETDRVYRASSQRLLRLRTDQETKAKPDDPSGDFSVAEPETKSAPPAKLTFSASTWEPKVKGWSRMFTLHPEILNSRVSVSSQRETKYFVNTEGARLEFGRQFARISISARAKHLDGMDLIATETFEGETAERLPKDEVVKAAVDKTAADVIALLKAPETEPLTTQLHPPPFYPQPL